jgi:hypothetical protein
VKRCGRDGPIWVAIHICRKTTQRISLCSYLHLKLAKMPCFSYYLLCLFFSKIGEQEGRRGSAWRWGRGEVAQIMYIHVSKCKYEKYN